MVSGAGFLRVEDFGGHGKCRDQVWTLMSTGHQALGYTKFTRV